MPPSTPPWTFSRHALERALDMALTAQDIIACLDGPEQTYDSTKYPGTRIYQRGRIAMAVDGKHVITVLWRESGYDRTEDLEKRIRDKS